jgi:hypothetical protein
MTGSLCDSRLLVLQAMDAITAFSHIASLLNFPSLCSSTQGYQIPSTMRTPRSLTPTLLQQPIPHYPYVDVLPFPSLRNRILAAALIINELEYCCDLRAEAFKVWGSTPWDPASWARKEILREVVVSAG